jgi:hypothetical protein
VTTNGDGAVHDEDLPDPQLFWRWVGKATRPVIGWVLLAVGAIMIIVGYIGVANEVLVAKQIPYLVSGGILGVAVVAVGVMFLGTEQIRRDSGRLDRLERMVEELHSVLLTRSDAPALELAPDTRETPIINLVALPDGDRYHRSECASCRASPTWPPSTCGPSAGVPSPRARCAIPSPKRAEAGELRSVLDPGRHQRDRAGSDLRPGRHRPGADI